MAEKLEEKELEGLHLEEKSETSLEPTSTRFPVDRETLSAWIANCDPYTSIDPADQRYFDFGQGRDLRGRDHVEGLFDAITLSGQESCQLFSGFSGTGKSTELRRLKYLLEEEGYAVLLVDVRDYHNLNHPLAIEDLMVILAGAFGDATAEVLGGEAVSEGYWTRFLDFLRTDIELEEIKVKAGVLDLKGGIKHAKPFWIELRAALSASPGKLRTNSHEYIRSCVARLRKNRKTSRGVVFIVDSLERLGSSVLEFQEMMQSVARVLTESPDSLRLPDCHVIYSIPPYVRLIRPDLGDHYTRVTLVMPAIKVLERGMDPSSHRPGVEALCSLVARRLPVDRVFGERSDLLEKLVVYSGGHVRTLLVFIKEMLFSAFRQGFPVDDTDIEQAVQPFREQAQLGIWRDTLPLLEKIIRSGSLGHLTRDEYASLAEYMDAYIVLCYRNGDGWYEVRLFSRICGLILAGGDHQAHDTRWLRGFRSSCSRTLFSYSLSPCC